MRLVVCSILLLCGCASPKVRCDTRLVPINPPAPAVAATPANSVSSVPARRAP